MFQNILVPVDGSQLAERALPYAERLANATGARLHLVRVVEALPHAAWAPVPSYVPPDVYEAEAKQATAYLAALAERLSSRGLRVHTEQLTGNAAAALLDYEQASTIDFVVICSHGRSGLARFTLGSVADRLLQLGTAPVLLVRAFGPVSTLEQAILPLDGSERAEQALHELQGLAGTVIHEVTLLRTIHDAENGPEAERYLDDVAARLSTDGLTVTRTVVQGDPAEAIITAAGANKLVLMATHGRGDLTRWAMGSVADRIAHAGVAALLLVRRGMHV